MKPWTLHEAPPDSPKKWAVRVPNMANRSGPSEGKTVLFGARGYEDFTLHHDVERRERYRARHQNDRLDDPYAPGFWSMWVLWGESPDLATAFKDAVRKAKHLLEKNMPRENPERWKTSVPGRVSLANKERRVTFVQQGDVRYRVVTYVDHQDRVATEIYVDDARSPIDGQIMFGQREIQHETGLAAVPRVHEQYAEMLAKAEEYQRQQGLGDEEEQAWLDADPRDNPEVPKGLSLPEGFTTKFGQQHSRIERPPETPSAHALRTAKRGDVVQVGNTQWLVYRRDEPLVAFVYKHPSKHTKNYKLILAGHDTDDVNVWEIGGSGQKISDILVTGQMAIVGHEARDNPMELLLLNPTTQRELPLHLIPTLMNDLSIPKPWRTRFMQGLQQEWDACAQADDVELHDLPSLGVLVVQHLRENADYYRQPRSNPASVVHTAREEHLWERAKSIAAQQGHPEDFAYIMGIFTKMNAPTE